jgi:Leucine-rich repeat (LRR) protein
MQVRCFKNLDYFDVTFNLIESPPGYIIETCNVSAILLWLSKWQVAYDTQILNFASANLHEVPLEFASLDTKMLTEINFSSNQISMIPDILSRFHSLTELLINNNKLLCIPNAVFSLSRLQTLHVQDNLITGSAFILSALLISIF